MDMQDINAILGTANPVETVTEGILQALQKNFPSWLRFTDEIKVNQPQQFFVDLFDPVNRTAGPHNVDRSVQVDIVAYAEGMRREEYLKLAAAMDRVFLPVLRFGARAITIEKTNADVVDDMLHYTFGVTYRDGEAPFEPPAMETLQQNIGGQYA